MPVARYQLPDGRIARFEVPEGTTPEQAQQIGNDFFAQQQIAEPQATQEPIDTTGMSRQERRRAARESRPEPVDVFAGLPQQTKDRIIQETSRSGRGSGAVPAMRKRLASLEQLRQVNPVLADEIENMDGVEAALIGAGGSVQNMIDGLDRIFGDATAEDVKKPHLDALKNIRSSAELGEILGETSMFAVPGGAASNIPKAGARIAAGGALGAAEGNIMARGQGLQGDELALPTIAGAFGGAVSPELVKVAAKPLTKATDWLKQGRTVNTPKTATQGPAPRTPEQQAIKDKIAQGVADKDTAGYKINNKGQLVKDPIEKEVLSQGWDEGITPVIKASTNLDRNKMRAMVEIYRRGTENLLDKAKRRPANVVGQSIMDRYNAVRDLNRSAGTRLDDVAQSELAGKKVDFSPAIDNFKSALEKRGIVVNDDWTLDYLDSTIEFKGPVKRRLNQVLEKMKRASVSEVVPMDPRNPQLSSGGVDALRGHKVKQFIREMLDYGKNAQTNASTDIDNILKGLSSDIDGVLDANFPKYNQVNTIFADTRTAMDAFAKEAGSKFRPDDSNVDSFAGVLARTFLSNNRGRAPLYSALEGLESAAKKHGKSFDDNIMHQVVFIEEMERLLGPSAQTSLFGDVAKAVERGVTQSVGGAALDLAKDTMKRFKGQTPENALRKMQQYLASFNEAA